MAFPSLKIGCPGGVAVVLSFAWKALNGIVLPELVYCMDDHNHRGWTSIFDSSSGGNSIGSSEGSVNQPVPDSPEPVAPAAPVPPEADQPDGGGPLIPELPNHLIPVEDRMGELGHRLTINGIGKKLTYKEWGSIVAAQAVVEERIEAALVHDGFDPETIMAKRHQVRGFLFYPSGTSFSEQTYVDYLKSIDNRGTRACVLYKRIIQAIWQHNLSLEWED